MYHFSLNNELKTPQTLENVEVVLVDEVQDLTEVECFLLLLYAKSLGEKTKIVENKHCNQVGEILGSLHKKSKDFQYTRTNNMNYNEWKRLFLKCKEAKDNQHFKIMSNINELM